MKGVDMLSPIKKGTKLTDNPKNITLHVRLTKDENDLLNDCANRLNASKTDVVLKGIKLVKECLDQK